MNFEQHEKIAISSIGVENLQPEVNRFVYWLARQLMTLMDRKLARLPLEAKELIAFAEQRTKLTDWDDDKKETVEALKRLTSPRGDYASLSRFGSVVFKRILIDRLCNRLRIVDYVKQNPEIRQVKIERPIFIVGLPRTGTSYLQQMLSCDPNCHPFQSWYADQITPAPRLNSSWSDFRKLKQRIHVLCFNALMPELKQIHQLSSSGVDECLPLLMNTLMTDAFGLFADLPEYSDWLTSREMSAAYQFYHLQLQILQFRLPQGHWVLKSPAHLPHLAEIFTAFPDANIVHIHRDPRKSIPSLLSLRFKLMGLFNDYTTSAGEELTRQSLKTAVAVIDKVTKERSLWNDRQMLDVQYGEFIQNPEAVCCRILEHFGYETGAVLNERLALKVKAAEKRTKSRHNYSLDMFGLKGHTIDALFENYCAKYTVSREQS